MATCPVGRVCSSLIRRRRPERQPRLLKTENTLHLPWRLKANALQYVCSGIQNVSEHTREAVERRK